MHKLPGEQELCELVEKFYFLFMFPTGQRRLTLSTHRVRYLRSESGSGTLRSIMLEQVTSCVMTHASMPVLLVSAFIFPLLGLFSMVYAQQGSGGTAFACFVIGGILLLFYFLSRERVLRINSAEGAINFGMRGTVEMSVVRAFIDDLEAAKNDRYFAGRKVVIKPAKPASPGP